MAEETHIEPHRDGAVIDMYVQPRSSRSEVLGPHAGALRIRVTAPPVDGAANDAVIVLLSERLQVRRTNLEIVGGATGRRKRVLVRGLSPDEVRGRLRRAGAR